MNAVTMVAEAVRDGRARRQLTQIALAQQAGVSVNRIVEIEHEQSNPRLTTVEAVLAPLGLRLCVEAM